MSVLGNFFRRVFGQRQGRPEARVIGHRGVAAGSIAERQAEGQPTLRVRRRARVSLAPGIEVEQHAFTEAERQRFQATGPQEVEGFVYRQEPMSFHSTNVFMAQYHAADKKLMVEFHNGRSYLYSGVSPEEAISLAQVGSKGRWVWDQLRRSGKAFTRLS